MAAALDGRVAIVTGGARGLGRVYAERLAAAGARVAIADVLDAQAADTAAEVAAGLGAGPDRVRGLGCDVTDEDAVAALVADVRAWADGPLVLVNNAGGALLPTTPAEELRRHEDWQRVLDVNLTGQWLCARAVTPPMRSDGYGKIINVTSAMVGRGWPVGLSAYVAAKAGVVGLTRALARELGPAGIRVNALAPGYVPLPASGKKVHSAGAEPELRARIAAEQCLPTTLVPGDLAGPMAFLAGPDSDAVTGQVLTVDGGWVLGG